MREFAKCGLDGEVFGFDGWCRHWEGLPGMSRLRCIKSDEKNMEGGVGEQRIQMSINSKQWDNRTQNNVHLQEIDQYDRECPVEIAGGNSNEHDGQEWDTHTNSGSIVQSSRKDS